jgi:hypothetical protein
VNRAPVQLNPFYLTCQKTKEPAFGLKAGKPRVPLTYSDTHLDGAGNNQQKKTLEQLIELTLGLSSVGISRIVR